MNAFLTKWKQLAKEKKLTRYDMAFYCLSKAMRYDESLKLAKKFLSEAFTPVTKKIKLDNGAQPYHSLYDALWIIQNAIKAAQAPPMRLNKPWDALQPGESLANNVPQWRGHSYDIIGHLVCMLDEDELNKMLDLAEHIGLKKYAKVDLT